MPFTLDEAISCERNLDDYAAMFALGEHDLWRRILVVAARPSLPFPDHAFDLALSPYCLFRCGEQLSFDFHLAALRELCRVAGEVRVFPVRTLTREIYPHMNSLIDELAHDGWAARLERIGEEAMLRCTISVHSRIVSWPRRPLR